MPTIYVRKTGNDANNGTDPDTDAVLTISRAEVLASSGDTIDFGAGTWAENITLSNVTYQGLQQSDGAGFWRTIIQGIPSGYESTEVLKCQDIKFESSVATVIQCRTVQLTRCWIHLGGVYNPGYFTISQSTGVFDWDINNCWFTNGVFNSNRFVFWNNAGVNSDVRFIDCIFYNLTNGFREFSFSPTTSGRTFSVVNCIFDTVDNLAKDAEALVTYSGNLVLTREYNCYNNCTGVNTGNATGTGEIVEDPLFEDPANGLLFLKRNSPCIGAGTVNP